MDWLLQTLLNPITLFDDLRVFDEAMERCRRHGFVVELIDCREYQTQEEVCNAILHRLGVLHPDYWYNKINLDQFWDLLLRPEVGDASGAVLGFRYYDTFFRNDPRSAQIVLELLAEHYHGGLRDGDYFLIVAHCEDRGLKMEPVLKMEAEFARQKDFSEKSDLRKAHGEIFNNWYREVAQQFNARYGENVHAGDVRIAWYASFGSRNAEDSPDMLPDVEEGFRMVKELQLKRAEEHRNDPGAPLLKWQKQVGEMVAARSPVEPTPQMVITLMSWLMFEGGITQRPEEWEPEAAADYMLQLEPEVWERVEPSKFSWAAYRKGQLSQEPDTRSPRERRIFWDDAILPFTIPKPSQSDWLLQTLHAPVNLFDDSDVFDGMVERCKRLGYEVHEFDCRQFKSREDILNAILHSVGELSPDHFYKGILYIQFWDMFRKPWIEDDCRALLAFRHFDTFHRLDPECGQQLMEMLADRNYRALLRGGSFLICAHCEDEAPQLEPVLVAEARWNSVKCFSEEADIGKQKMEKAAAWLRVVQEKFLAQRTSDKAAPQVFGPLLDVTGHENIVALWEADIPVDEAVRLAMQWDEARDWWNGVAETFAAGSEEPLTLRLAQIALSRKIRKRFFALYRDNISIETALQLVREAVDEEFERQRHDGRFAENDWHTQVHQLFNAQSEAEKPRQFIYDALNIIGRETAARPNWPDTAPQDAVNLLLRLTPEQLKSIERKSKIVQIEDKDVEL